MAKLINQDNRFDKKNNKDTTRINEAIRAREVRLVDENGEAIGVFAIKDALAKAIEEGLDLVEVNPEGNPPVCKILDYGKFKYSVQKNKKKQKVTVLKEVQIHLNTGIGDYQTKLKKAQKFLVTDLDKVKIIVKMRGREMDYKHKALELLEKFYEDLGREEAAKIDVNPKFEGNNAIVIFSPVVSK